MYYLAYFYDYEPITRKFKNLNKLMNYLNKNKIIINNDFINRKEREYCIIKECKNGYLYEIL